MFAPAVKGVPVGILPQRLMSTRYMMILVSTQYMNVTDEQTVEFYLYPTVSTALVHSVKPKLTE